MPGAWLLAVVAVALLPAGARGQLGSPAGPVPVELLEARRSALMDSLNGLPAVVAAIPDAGGVPGDVPGDRRQSSDFFYLTGITTPGAWLALNLPEPGAAVLYMEPPDASLARWDGAVLGLGPETGAVTGVADVREAASLVPDLEGWLAGGTLLVSVAHPSQREMLAEVDGGLELGDARSRIAALRQVKDRDELRRLRRAVALTVDALSEAFRVARPGIHEYEMEAVIEFVFRSGGSERPGFPSIVGSGPNSTILHYNDNERRTDGDDLVVMDVGAEFGYYTADVTRTIPVSGRFTPRQRAIYELVLGAQNAALARVRPGVTVADLSDAARRHIADNSGNLCGSASCGRYFVHGLSHWLGMDVHDVGSYQVPLEPGMVLTVEPGIYLPDEELGVRIEDDVLVTEDGYELLSRGLPREPDAVELLMAREPSWIRALPSSPR